MFTEFFGLISGIVILASFFPYIRDIFSGRTKPERMSWLIWAVLGLISFSSQLAKGATSSLLFTGAQTLGDLFIFFLAIRFGIGGFSGRDVIASIGAGLSLLLWYFTREASFALLLVIFIDAIGVLLTVLKSLEQPETETASTWLLTFIAGSFGCLAVGKFDLILLAFPFYISLAGVSILAAIKIGMVRVGAGMTKGV